ncbi:MAG: PQQ-binding-like beta-propeller repeat protein, partial [Candidatus Eisenbacteria bacterium]|nr:PQQ-binding-like beta-propeller repeat protein [Candidatus Eisenbacteria bacterium]
MTDDRIRWDALTYDGSAPGRPVPSLHIFLKPADRSGSGPPAAQRLFQDLVARFYSGPPFLTPREKLADTIRHAIEEASRTAEERATGDLSLAVAIVDPVDEELHLFRQGDILLLLAGEENRLIGGSGYETHESGSLRGLAFLEASRAEEGAHLALIGKEERGRLLVAGSTIGIWVPLGEEGAAIEPVVAGRALEPERAPRASEPSMPTPTAVEPLPAPALESERDQPVPPAAEPPLEPERLSAPHAVPEPVPTERTADELRSPRSPRRRLSLLPFSLLLLLLLLVVFWNRAEREAKGDREETARTESAPAPSEAPAPEAAPVREPPPAPAGTPAWSFRAGGAITSSPHVSGDRVFFGCRDG